MTHSSDAPEDMEIATPAHPSGPFQAAMLDFDGTLSLIRCNWQGVMIPMMLDELAALETGETLEELTEVVEEYVFRLTGRQTIHQMIQLAEEVEKRGGSPLDPQIYKHRFTELLWRKVGANVDSLKRGELSPQELTVPGAHALLQRLKSAGLTLYLASGTDLEFVEHEAAALEIDHFFEGRIFGPYDDAVEFSKGAVLQQMMDELEISGEQIVGFGDGFAETEEIKRIGGLAVGVASNEESREGVNQWKRQRLIEAGADWIVGDFRQVERLCAGLGI